MDNGNITGKRLGRKDLYLNKKGKEALALNVLI